jgi:hypothetical protein
MNVGSVGCAGCTIAAQRATSVVVLERALDLQKAEGRAAVALIDAASQATSGSAGGIDGKGVHLDVQA